LLLYSSYLPLGVPNWVVICPHQANFLAPLPGKKKTSARGVSHAHLLLCFSFALLYFTCIVLSKNTKKLVSFIVAFIYLLLVLLKWLLLKTPSCVILLPLIIVISSALLLRHLLLLQIFM
jgi:glucan phosphoethanolaminetransferase (alkaline phosphatase superfamily)